MPGPLYWMEAFARARGLRYEPDADERWLRVWEPYTTTRVPLRYEHALLATGSIGSISIARAVLEVPNTTPSPHPLPPVEYGTWIAIVQDERITTRAAVTSDFGSVFAEPLDLVSMVRFATGDAAFDHVFASFAGSKEDIATAITPSVRKLLLGWRVPIHAETRQGGFILVPVSLGPDERGLSWMMDAVSLFGEKATKRRT
ncbi:MAG: hypothetical protein KIT84_05570 [Labilithrix sp.]|nr:hypothetical protein [Labilithrix sp.]MCW5810457.1 hypothetical protein [Labilithrix sp.]